MTVRSVCDPAVMATEVGVTLKSVALVPESDTALMLSVAVPVFCTVSVALTDPPVVTVPRSSDPATEIIGAPSPVPDRATLVGLPLSLWVSASVAALAPVDDGEKVTVTSELLPADTLTVAGVAEKSPASAPDRETSLTTSVTFPELEMVSVCEFEEPS